MTKTCHYIVFIHNLQKQCFFLELCAFETALVLLESENAAVENTSIISSASAWLVLFWVRVKLLEEHWQLNNTHNTATIFT